MTNEELRELLTQYPDEAEIRIEALDSFGDPEISYDVDNRISWDSRNEEIVIDAT